LLAPWPKGAPRNRLGLAQCSRSAIIRYRARGGESFLGTTLGTGLVKTLEDFGRRANGPAIRIARLARARLHRAGLEREGLFKTLVLSGLIDRTRPSRPKLVTRDPENGRSRAALDCACRRN